ncbi:MAG: hypothetical protein ACXWKP_27260 [Bradyrhizobium sp.]
MPALFAYLIAVLLLLGGGYGALDWLAAPEPVKMVAKAKQPAPPPRSADDIGASSTQAIVPPANLSETAKPEVRGKPGVDGTDQVRTASNDKPALSDQRPSPRPEQSSAASRQDAKAEGSGPAQEQDRSAPTGTPPAAADREAKQYVEVPVPETDQDNSAPARQEEKQPAQAVSPGNAQSVAAIAPASAAKTPKRPYVRQASRRSEKRPLEMMTLRIVELPDGRRMTQLIPYRGADRRRDDRPAMAFGRDD